MVAVFDSKVCTVLILSQHFHRTTCPANVYAMSGLRQSAKAFLTLAGLHPNLAIGFHHLATARHGNFQAWWQVRKLAERTPGKYKLASNMTAEGCPCCNNANVADSLGHFIFECNNVKLTKIREDLCIKEFARNLQPKSARRAFPECWRAMRCRT